MHAFYACGLPRGVSWKGQACLQVQSGYSEMTRSINFVSLVYWYAQLGGNPQDPVTSYEASYQKTFQNVHNLSVLF